MSVIYTILWFFIGVYQNSAVCLKRTLLSHHQCNLAFYYVQSILYLMVHYNSGSSHGVYNCSKKKSRIMRNSHYVNWFYVQVLAQNPLKIAQLQIFVSSIKNCINTRTALCEDSHYTGWDKILTQHYINIRP